MRNLHKKSRLIQMALNIDSTRHRLIAVVGGGGKTTLIYTLAKELSGQGIKAAVTTTTHMYREERFGFTPLGCRAHLSEHPVDVHLGCQAHLSEHPVDVHLGAGYEAEKIAGFSPEIPQRLLAEYDVVLVEADGSKHLPLKVPAEHEPVLPEGADLVIGVAGAQAVGKTFTEACHRAELACANLDVGMEDKITPEHLLTIVTGDFGQKKGVTCEYRYVINLLNCPSVETEKEIQECMKKYEEQGAMLLLDPKVQ